MREAALLGASSCQGTMLAWCSRCEITISSPSPRCCRPQVAATRLMASVAPRTKIDLFGVGAQEPRHRVAGALVGVGRAGGQRVGGAVDVGVLVLVEVAQPVDDRPAASGWWRRCRARSAACRGPAPPGSGSRGGPRAGRLRPRWPRRTRRWAGRASMPGRSVRKYQLGASADRCSDVPGAAPSQDGTRAGRGSAATEADRAGRVGRRRGTPDSPTPGSSSPGSPKPVGGPPARK